MDVNSQHEMSDCDLSEMAHFNIVLFLKMPKGNGGHVRPGFKFVLIFNTTKVIYLIPIISYVVIKCLTG